MFPQPTRVVRDGYDTVCSSCHQELPMANKQGPNMTSNVKFVQSNSALFLGNVLNLWSYIVIGHGTIRNLDRINAQKESRFAVTPNFKSVFDTALKQPPN